MNAGLLGVILGLGASGGLLGAAVTKTVAARIGAGFAYVTGAFAFTVPFALVPLAPVPAGHGTTRAVIALLFAAWFLGTLGVCFPLPG